MSDESKPREWWINVDTSCPESEIYEEDDADYSWGKLTPVIERSAYDKLLAENQRLKDDVEYWKGSWKRYSEHYSDVKTELTQAHTLIEQMAGALEVYADEDEWTINAIENGFNRHGYSRMAKSAIAEYRKWKETK